MKALAVAGAVLVLAGGGLAGFALTQKPKGGMTAEQSSAMASAASELDGDIKGAKGAIDAQLSTLKGLLQVRSAIVGDHDTAKDMYGHGELAFNEQPGEIIDLGRRADASAPYEDLLVQPPGGMHTAHGGEPGEYLELMGTQLAITQVAKVEPPTPSDADPQKDAHGKIIGYLAISKPLDLAPPLTKLSTAGVNGSLAVGDHSVPIGSGVPAGAKTEEHKLTGDAKLVVAVPDATGGVPVPLVAGGGAAAILGLGLLVIGLTKKGGSPAANLNTQSGLTPPVVGSQQLPAASGRTPAPFPSSQQMGAVDASASTSLAVAGPGAIIGGRWQVIRRLGSGGMADVYLAHARGEAGFEKLVAIKVMHGHLARNQRAVDHFLDEARLAARITHPNVVQIQDLGKIGEDYVIVMEYVEGVDLEKLLMVARESGRLMPLDVALGILCRVCDGLDAAHKAVGPDGVPMGIIHRDVKAANVLVSKQGGVKVVDFGIAKAAAQSHYTVAGETKGTPAMMAPEQRVGEVVDVRADVYSVAAVGFELVTGQSVNLDLAALAHLGVENWPHLPPPSSLRAGSPPELDGVLLGAMAFERQKRPADCAALEQTIEGIMKRYGLAATDKDIARWVQGELAYVSPSDPARPATRV
ncbi:MAG TPA: serine/threonine-protein kinase [Kofleriaceae bacterium]